MMSIKQQLKTIKKSPGVYIFRDAKNKVLYIGKAKNLRTRVRSYFIGNEYNRPLIPRLVAETVKIEIKTSNSEVEAILLEAELIKRLKPPYNLRQKDDKSFIYVFINFADAYPKISFIRQKEIIEGRIKIRKKDKLFGPFLSGREIKKLLMYFRRIIPFRDCADTKYKQYQRQDRGCSWYEINKCPAPCAKKIKRQEYRQNIAKLSRLLSGKINGVKKELKREMTRLAKEKKYEAAALFRDRIKTLEHIKEVQLLEEGWDEELNQSIIAEAVDISNISGKYASGSIIKAKIFGLTNKISRRGVKVIFDKNGYRRFRIHISDEPNDTAMIGEVVSRRFKHPEWGIPDFLLIDGGMGQINVALRELSNLKIDLSVASIAKGPTRKGEKTNFSQNFDIQLKSTLLKNKRVIKLLRDEAHRFAISYHQILRRKGIIGK